MYCSSFSFSSLPLKSQCKAETCLSVNTSSVCSALNCVRDEDMMRTDNLRVQVSARWFSWKAAWFLKAEDSSTRSGSFSCVRTFFGLCIAVMLMRWTLLQLLNRPRPAGECGLCWLCLTAGRWSQVRDLNQRPEANQSCHLTADKSGTTLRTKAAAFTSSGWSNIRDFI